MFLSLRSIQRVPNSHAFRSFLRKFCVVNHYEELELPKTASKKDIKVRYKELVKKYHPDVYKGDDTRFKKITEAYKTLVSPKKRAEYDDSLKNNGKGVRKAPDIDWNDISDEYKSKATADDFYRDYNTIDMEKSTDLEKEYEKFINEKNSTQFGDLNVREDQIRRNMNAQDRKRAEFIHNFNRSKFEKVMTWKEEEQTFEEAVQDEINIKNNRYDDKDPIRANKLRKWLGIAFSLQGIAYFFVIGMAATMIWLAVFRVTERKEFVKNANEVRKEYEKEVFLEDIKMKFVFNDDDDDEYQQ